MAINCVKCSDRGVIIKKGKHELCECKLLKGWQKSLSPLMVDGALPKPTKSMQNLIKVLIKSEQKQDADKVTPKKYFLVNDDSRTTLDNVSARKYYRSVFAQYLIDTKRFLDVRIMPMYFLIDLYMGKVNQGLNSGEVEDTFYNLPNKTFIIYFDSFFRNVILLSTLQMFLDLYKDRNILFYLDTDAWKDKVIHEDWVKGKTVVDTSDLQVIPVLERGGLVDMIDLVRSKKGSDGIYK